MSQDIRKWFIKGHAKDSGNGNTSKQAKPSTPEKPPVVQGVNESSSRRKTSKYFAKDAQSVKDEMEVEQVSGKKAQTGSAGSANAKPPLVKRTHKLVNNDDEDDDDFVTPTSRKGSTDAPPSKKLKSGSGKGVARQIIDDTDEDEDETVKSNAKSTGSGKGRGAKGSAATQTTVESMNVDESDADDKDAKDTQSVKPGGRGRGGRGAPAGGRGGPAGGRGRGGGGRGGFMNFGEREDPPHKGEKEVPEGAPDCLNGLTFVISGTLDSLEREEAEDLIKRHGGRVTGSVSKKTNYLLCDVDIGGQKSKKARELKTEFLTEDGLFDMIRASIKSEKPVDKVAPSPPKKSPQKSEKSKQAGQTLSNSDTKGLTSVSASSKQKNQSTPQTLLPWTEKYRPKVPNDIVGNQSLVKQLHDWLVHWNDQFIDAKQKKGKKQSDSGAKKAVMLSGTPGIGKTTSAKLVSQMLGFQTIEVNASDSRGKADGKIERGIHGSNSNCIKELVNNQALSLNRGSSRQVKTVLIMDEVDGMSAGDRGGVADLIATIKISKIPIICICNDRYSQKLKSLNNYCLMLNFRKPTKQQVAKRLSQIASSEGLQANDIALEELAERSNGDIRLALNHLQYMGLSMSIIKFDDIKQHLQSNSKDESISPFTAVDKLFGFNGGKLRMDERIDLSMSDIDLVPLLIQENYINYRPNNAAKDDNGMKRMNLLARSAESIGDGDIINVQIRRYRQWQLSQSGCVASCIIPAALMHGQRQALEQGEQNYNKFGGWLGKNSTMGKNYRLLEDLHVHLLASRESNLGRSTLRLDYLTLLSRRLTEPLKNLSKDEAVEKVVEFMGLYSISMEDFDTIMELLKYKGHPSPLDGILPAVKSALKKAYNKGSSSRVIKTADLITLPGIKKAPKKRVAAMLEPVDDASAENAENEEENLSDAEDEEDDSADPENQQLRSDLQSLNSKAIEVQMELKGSASSSGTKAPAGRGKGGSADGKGGGRGRGSGSASKRKR